MKDVKIIWLIGRWYSQSICACDLNKSRKNSFDVSHVLTSWKILEDFCHSIRTTNKRRQVLLFVKNSNPFQLSHQLGFCYLSEWVIVILFQLESQFSGQTTESCKHLILLSQKVPNFDVFVTATRKKQEKLRKLNKRYFTQQEYESTDDLQKSFFSFFKVKRLRKRYQTDFFIETEQKK